MFQIRRIFLRDVSKLNFREETAWKDILGIPGIPEFMLALLIVANTNNWYAASLEPQLFKVVRKRKQGMINVL